MEYDVTIISLLIGLCGFIVSFFSFSLGRKKEYKKDIKEETVQKTITNDKIKTLEEKFNDLEKQLKDSQANPTAQAKLEMLIEYIKEGVDDIKNKMKSIEDDAKNTKENLEKKINLQSEKIARHDENLKSLHKRVDEFEEKINLFSERK